MIGVLSKPGQAAVVAEFFELFKTPWEFCQEGRAYDVVIATTDELPEVDARLLVLYGSEIKSCDQRNDITVRWRHGGGRLNYQGGSLPLFGEFVSFEKCSHGVPLVLSDVGIAGLRVTPDVGPTVIRVGYDLFQEVELLFSVGQPVELASIPTLDIHIRMLRGWILNEGIPLLEIPPVPGTHSFAVCLTHDIDFVGIRNHKFDHTMWGFLYRSTVGAVRNLLRRRISLSRVFESWLAAASLPFIYLGWAKDFWAPFEWYLRVEKGLRSTYFLIPFKGRAGEHVPASNASRRATGYDVGDVPEWTQTLEREGCELGVHGIDAWHSVEKGRAELLKLTGITGKSRVGIRMHWLLQNDQTASILEKSGYAYDSTAGYNETVGYRNGTTQVYRPLGASTLLELPLHIQDGALFYPQRLDLSESEAEKRCADLIENAEQFGGVLTILWHDRSHGPERFWGDFYKRLIRELQFRDVWFATASELVAWFRKRREARFDRIGGDNGARISLADQEEAALPPLRLRIYHPTAAGTAGDVENRFTDIPCFAGSVVQFESSLRRAESSCPLPKTCHEISLHSLARPVRL